MTTTQPFSGFPKETIAFFNSLKKNNTKPWFQKNKAVFDREVMGPAKAFVGDMGRRLQELSPEIIAVPQVNRSIFRIYRDTRFSSDKTPYKTHLGIFFWEGRRAKMECPGYYFHLEPPKLILGGGLYMFSSELLERYRNAVVHPEFGSELADILAEISRLEGYTLGGKHYKRIPHGYDKEHPSAEWLLYSGLYAGIEGSIPKEIHSKELLDFCMEKFRRLAPLHSWLVKLTEGEFTF